MVVVVLVFVFAATAVVEPMLEPGQMNINPENDLSETHLNSKGQLNYDTASGSNPPNRRQYSEVESDRGTTKRPNPSIDRQDTKRPKGSNPSDEPYNSKGQPDRDTADNSGCAIDIESNPKATQPVYIHVNSSDYLRPYGNTGWIYLRTGEQIKVACTGSGNFIKHSNDVVANNITTGIVTCVNKTLVSGQGWLKGNVKFGDLKCKIPCTYDALKTNFTCFNDNLVIGVGYKVDNDFYTLYSSCFDVSRMEVLYVWYHQSCENCQHQKVSRNLKWLGGNFFPDVEVDNKYKQAIYNNSIAQYVGQELALEYFTSHSLSRGHLAAASDFVFTTGQRATFNFINVAPQWQSFNGGNWNLLEENLRARIASAGYNAVIYTGTFGVTQLRNQYNSLVDIYLDHERNRIPVPLYFYKVAYDESRGLSTAFIGINNPYYTEDEVRKHTFCKDQCRNNPAFSWLRWQPNNIKHGYSFCCYVDEFMKAVPHLPAFPIPTYNINLLI